MPDKNTYDAIPNEGENGKRYYQELAINNAVNAIAEGKERGS